MDNLNIRSKFLLGILSKIIGRAIKSSTGYDVNISLESVNATGDDNDMLDVHVEGTVSMKLTKGQLSELTNGLL